MKIVFLCSPNNPSGNLLSRAKIIEVLNSVQALVVVDEAYIDFTDQPSFSQELANYPNLVILQTFSKAWGLAGLRLGMSFASESIIGVLNKIKYPYNVNIRTQELALEAMAQGARKDTAVKTIIAERTIMARALEVLPITRKVYPSDANFLLVQVSDAPGIYHKLMDLGIIVRDRSRVALCDNCLRITIGTPEENKRLLQTLATF